MKKFQKMKMPRLLKFSTKFLSVWTENKFKRNNIDVTLFQFKQP